MVVSLNYCSQNGGNLYRAPYYNGNPNVGPRIIGNVDQYPYICYVTTARISYSIYSFDPLLQLTLHHGNPRLEASHHRSSAAP